MSDPVNDLLAGQGDVATTAQLLAAIGRAAFESQVAGGELAHVWTGVYSRVTPDDRIRLSGLDLRAGEPVAICLHTAAAAYGFDTEDVDDLHVLTPPGHQLRNSDGLVVHRREGAPLAVVQGRPATDPAWTAVEVARCLRRPRALATLDAALRSGHCTVGELLRATKHQKGRRGIIAVRELVPLANPLAESPMESESRLAMHDGGLPAPVLQFEILDRSGRVWRVDFAWPARRLAVEYDGFDWHHDPEQWRQDRRKRAALREMGWTLLSITADDVRRYAPDMVRRIRGELTDVAA